MYNRYIPQPDGTYRRNRLQEPQRQEHTRSAPSKPPAEPLPPPCPPTEHCQERRGSPEPRPCPAAREHPAGSFLKNLLPKDLDTGDLLIILLLLLVAGDSEAEKSNALLTLALYFLL